MRRAPSTSRSIVRSATAVVLERPDRLERHRVHRVRPDQLLDVDHVAVVGVLRRRRRPQAALRRGAGGRQLVPVRPGEDLLIGRVRELRVGDRQRALELVVAADLVEPAVGLGVHARDEERRHRRDRARVTAPVDQALQAADVRLGHLAVALEREDQRHVDGDAGGDRLLDRRQARGRGGDLHQQVRALDERVQALGLGDRGLGVVREVRVDLERDPAVLAVALVPDGAAAHRRRHGCRRARARGRSPSARTRPR